MYLKILLPLALILCFANDSIAQDYRYTNDQFETVTVLNDVVYGTAPYVETILGIESITTTDDLLMDVYLPEGDTNSLRPAIVFAHGGGFFSGSKSNEDMVALCELFARKGYVTVSISYRLGFHILGNVNLHAIRAVYRGLQDGKAAIRYLRANANTYGIDDTKVYFVGSSAGSFIGLHSIYMDDLNEKPAQAGEVEYANATFPFLHTAPDLGDYDIGDHLNFKGEPDALVSLWGAVQNTNLIQLEDDESVLLVHGHDDVIVPFNNGSPFSIPLLDSVEGSNLIKNRLDNIGLNNNETYFVEGQGHEFYGVLNGTFLGDGGNEYWPVIVDRMTTFLWNEHKPIVDFETSVSGLNVDFENTSLGALSWYWDFGDGNFSTDENPNHTYTNPGNYDVKLYIENDILSWNEVTKTVNTETLSLDQYGKLNFSFYPNPVSDVINLTFNQSKSDITINIYNLTGQLVAHQRFNNTTTITLNIAGLSPSMYILNVETEADNSQLKIIKN